MTTRRKTRKRTRPEVYAPGRDQRIKTLIARGLINNPTEIPPDAIPAALELQSQRNSYNPKIFYQDVNFLCRDCRKPQTWTAAQQRWWYEKCKGIIYSQALHCRECRAKRRKQAALHHLSTQAGIERKQARLAKKASQSG